MVTTWSLGWWYSQEGDARICAANLNTARCKILISFDSIDDNMVLWDIRLGQLSSSLQKKTCIEGPVHYLPKIKLQTTKLVTPLLNRSITDHPSVRISRSLIFQFSSKVVNTTCSMPKKGDIEKFYLVVMKQWLWLILHVTRLIQCIKQE